jgi:hypothetical protein
VRSASGARELLKCSGSFVRSYFGHQRRSRTGGRRNHARRRFDHRNRDRDERNKHRRRLDDGDGRGNEQQRRIERIFKRNLRRQPINFDGGCLIDDGLVEAGTWLRVNYGSCTVCDPAVNPTDWTQRSPGDLRKTMGTTDYNDPWVLHTPVSGRCSSTDYPPFSACDVRSPGDSRKSDEVGCAGGFCGDDAGVCLCDQNLASFDSCEAASNYCAQGPCRMDAGWDDIHKGGGWCCGLIDGGVQTRLALGDVCFVSANCCEGLICLGDDSVFDVYAGPGSSDAGFGLCEPQGGGNPRQPAPPSRRADESSSFRRSAPRRVQMQGGDEGGPEPYVLVR